MAAPAREYWRKEGVRVMWWVEERWREGEGEVERWRRRSRAGKCEEGRRNIVVVVGSWIWVWVSVCGCLDGV